MTNSFRSLKAELLASLIARNSRQTKKRKPQLQEPATAPPRCVKIQFPVREETKSNSESYLQVMLHRIGCFKPTVNIRQDGRTEEWKEQSETVNAEDT
jgi:hypothetical protein